MNAVLDVSAAFAVVRQLPDAKAFEAALLDAALVTAPSLYVAEAANVAWKFCRIEQVPVEDARLMAEHVLAMVDVWVSDAHIWREAFGLAHSLSHSVYDCFYLALALREKAVLLTADRKLAERAHALGIALA